MTHRLSLLLTLAVVAGCGGEELDYEAARLEGEVTIDGEPVPQGNLTFMPLDASAGPTAGAAIEEGHYVAEGVPLGKVNVTFSISETVPDPNDSHGQAVLDLVPAKHRDGVEINVTSDSDSQDFNLTTN